MEEFSDRNYSYWRGYNEGVKSMEKDYYEGYIEAYVDVKNHQNRIGEVWTMNAATIAEKAQKIEAEIRAKEMELSEMKAKKQEIAYEESKSKRISPWNNAETWNKAVAEGSLTNSDYREAIGRLEHKIEYGLLCEIKDALKYTGRISENNIDNARKLIELLNMVRDGR
jgi:Skp family chaperone for outer membrane proteins